MVPRTHSDKPERPGLLSDDLDAAPDGMSECLTGLARFSSFRKKYLLPASNPPCIQENPTRTPFIYSDSQNAIANARMPPGWLQEALRHVKTAFHFFKQFVYEKLINLEHCRSEDNPADIMTKGWGKAKTHNQKSNDFKKHAEFCLGRR